MSRYDIIWQKIGEVDSTRVKYCQHVINNVLATPLARAHRFAQNSQIELIKDFFFLH